MNFKYLVLSLLGTSFIVFVSSIPDQSLLGNGSMCEQIISNLAHIPAYGLLTIFWLKTFESKKSRSQFFKFNGLVLIGIALFAVSDEIHQSFVPGRIASFLDLGLNTVGILSGLSVFKISRAYHIL